MMTSEQEQEQIQELFPSATEFHDSLGGRMAYLHIGGGCDEQCTSCGKRRSPSSSSGSEPQHPKSKKPMLQLQSPHDHSQEEQETNPFHGFTKVPLPFPVFTTATPAAAAKTDLSSASSSPPIPELRRSVSDPFLSPGLNEFSSGSAPAPLRRSVSDPFNSPGVVSDLPKSKNDTPPPTAAAARSLPPLHPRSTGSQIITQMKKSPNSSRLKRMKERMREMSQWWDEIIQEEDEEEEEKELAEPEEDDNDISTICRQDVSGTEGEEEVKVERVKEGFNIKFTCPCGKGYHILVYGKNCYYKLL